MGDILVAILKLVIILALMAWTINMLLILTGSKKPKCKKENNKGENNKGERQ